MTQTLSTLNHRQRLKMSVRFHLRHGQTTGEKPRQIYIRLVVNGTKCSDYCSGVYARPDKWHSGHQKALGSSSLAQEINKELDAILAEHKNLLAELLRLHNAGIIPNLPAAELVKQHWTRKTTLIPTLMEAYNIYVTYLRSLAGTPGERDRSTLTKWENGRTHLAAYIAFCNAERLTVDLLTKKWAEGFYYYLIKRPLGKAGAARFVGHLRASINYLIDIQQVGNNPIAIYFPDKGKDKLVYFLEQEHLDWLWALDTPTETHRLVRDWLLLMCYTGMDQPDLERYVANLRSFEEQTEAGIMIVIKRGKTDLIACIPLPGEIGRILSKYPAGIPTQTNQSINRWATIIEKQIGFNERLTTKICRKTAGALFLRAGYRLEEVSKVLGHSSIQATPRNYLKVTGAMVKAGMVRVQGPSAERQHNPFTHIHKAS